MLGTLTLSPARRRCGLYADFLPGRSVTAADVIAHLRRLRRRLKTPLVVVLDNLRQHKSAELVAWCEQVGDVPLEYLPPYAPELNAIEPAWSHSKYVTAVGRLSETAEDLHALAEEAITNASEQRLLRGFLRSTKLPLAFNLQTRNNSIAQRSI